MQTVLPVAQRGEAILTLIAAPISESEFGSAWLNTLADAMQDTMFERNGVGIAAPQVYISKRVIIVASRPNPRYPDAPEMDAVVMVNPEILAFSIVSLLLSIPYTFNTPACFNPSANEPPITPRPTTVTVISCSFILSPVLCIIFTSPKNLLREAS